MCKIQVQVNVLKEQSFTHQCCIITVKCSIIMVLCHHSVHFHPREQTSIETLMLVPHHVCVKFCWNHKKKLECVWKQVECVKHFEECGFVLRTELCRLKIKLFWFKFCLRWKSTFCQSHYWIWHSGHVTLLLR